jgi:YfiH family protein
MSVARIIPNWPAPPSIRAVSTRRGGGVSLGVYASLNLGAHVGDLPAHVAANRQLLRETLPLPAEPLWLNQIHGASVVEARTLPGLPPDADAAFSLDTGVVCAVLTADCLPVLFCDRAGSRVAAAHAGWRGLAGGVLEATVEALGGGGDLLAWLGPAIGPTAFEVGADVKAAFADKLGDCDHAFTPVDASHWLADLYQLARITLVRVGLAIHNIHGGGECTYSDPERYFSYRRDGQTGRMATLIWRE